MTGRVKSRAVLLGAALLAAPAPAARADEVWAFFEEEGKVLAAAKHAQTVAEAPANAHVITAADIRAYGFTTLGEALQSVPGFYVTDDRNYSYLWVRGFGRPGDYSGRVLILLNGHRMNENVFGGAYFAQESGFDLRGVQRIEVIKGPGAALYGDSAFFAVVNVVTQTPAQARGARVQADGGSFGAAGGFLSLGVPWRGGGAAFSGGLRRSRGQDHAYKEFAAVNGGRAEGQDSEESGSLFASVSEGGFTLAGAFSSRAKQVPTGAFGTRFADARFETFDSREFLELQWTGQVHRALGLELRAYRDGYFYHGDYPYDYAAPPPDSVLFKDFGRGRWYGMELRGRLTPWGARDALTVGAEFERNTLARLWSYDADPYASYLDVQRETDRKALFLQQELGLGADAALTAGARFDRYGSFGDVLNPRAAVVLHPRESSVLKLAYGTAFRAPTLYESAYYDSNTWKPNPDLGPERIRTYEVNWVELVAAGRTLSVGAFDNRVRNLISQTVDPADGLTQFGNLDQVRSQGIELDLAWRESRRLGGHLGTIAQYTRSPGGTRLSNSPRQTVAFGLRLEPLRDLSIGLESFFIGRRKTYQGGTLAASLQTSLQVSWRPHPAGPRLFAGVRNLFDSPYQISGSIEHQQDGIAQNGREWRGGMEVHFGR